MPLFDGLTFCGSLRPTKPLVSQGSTDAYASVTTLGKLLDYDFEVQFKLRAAN